MNDHLLEALQQVLGWDLPDEDLADAVNAQARLMAGYCPDDYYHDSNQVEQISSPHR